MRTYTATCRYCQMWISCTRVDLATAILAADTALALHVREEHPDKEVRSDRV